MVASDPFPWIISGNFEEKLSVETSLCLIHLGDVFVASLSVTKVHFQASSRNRASETNKMDPGSSQVPHLETILREDVNEKWGYFSSKDQPCIVHLDFLLLNGGADKYKSTSPKIDARKDPPTESIMTLQCLGQPTSFQHLPSTIVPYRTLVPQRLTHFHLPVTFFKKECVDPNPSMIRITKVCKDMFDIHQKSKYTKKYKPGTKFHWSSPHHNGFPEMLPWLRPYPDTGGEHHRHNSQMERVNLNHFKFFPTRKVASFQATQHERWHLYIISVLSSKNNSDPRMSQKIHPRKANLLDPSLVYSCKSQLEPKRQRMPGNHQMSSGITAAHCFRYTSTLLQVLYPVILSKFHEGCYTQGTQLLQCFPRNNGEDEAGLEFDANLSNMPEVNQPATP